MKHGVQDLAARVSEQVQRRPEARAIVASTGSLTFGDLERRSNRLAHTLDAAGAKPGDRVVLALQKSPEAIVGMLACLKRGLLYVPIDAMSPAPRAQKIVDACDPAVVLTHAAAAPIAQALRPAAGGERGTWTLVAVDPGAPWEQAPDDSPAPPIGPQQPAHILFTSGSTGTPKGVVVGQPSILAFLDWAIDYFGITADDRRSGHSPLHFDLSTFDIFGSLTTGAELHLVPAEINLLAPKLATWIRDSELTHWFSVPSILTYLVKFDAIRPHDFPQLDQLMWCGEVLPTPVLRKLMALLPHARFTNLYGPTEATIASSFHTVAEVPDDDRCEIPIGRPCAGEALHVLDEQLRPAAPDSSGELFLSGAGLALGYWRDPETTAKAFLQSPELAAGADGRIYRTGDLARLGADGLVYFQGRADSQIKSRGYRIELGEIEAALATLGEVREGVIVALPTGGFEGWIIACAYAPQPDQVLTPAQLRQRLAALLPSYMLPTRWMQLDTLPRTSNGKADRRSVRELFMAPPGAEAPLTR